MDSSSVNEVSTSGRMNESENEGEGRLEQFSGFPGQLVSYPPGSDVFREFCKAKAVVGGKWGVKSTVERKESQLDEVVEVETELELVLGELGLSRKKKVDSRSKKVLKTQSARSMTGVDEGKRQTSSEDAGPNPSRTTETSSSAQPKPVKPSKVAQLFLKKRVLKTMPAPDAMKSGEAAKEKRRRVKSLGRRLLRYEPLSWMTLEMRKGPGWRLSTGRKTRARWLGCHLMLKGYSQEEVDAIKADTYVEVEDEEEKVVGVVDGLDGASRQTVLNNQGDDVELPEGGSEKVAREMSLKINELESGLARERETSISLLSAQAELQVKLDTSRALEDHVLMYNWEFVEQFDRMKDLNENREDQYVKAHFRLEKLNQVIYDLTLQVLERFEEHCRSDLQICRNDLGRIKQKIIEKDDELRAARENLSASKAVAEHLQTAFPVKDIEFREM
ncbi:hypothetical protein GIB67_016271 [Kingdonia uniflora]|uniref:Uncharacterized protein n=1 Tax=Kingdonia uniflora TaxID=39325 RepID=A0A7J7M9A1_9MAGN|nr:hypothetical protein GIB67_016271 [Kingdonia uniflora]